MKKARLAGIAKQRKSSMDKTERILKEYAKIESMRYICGFSFFKHHRSIIEYDVMRKDEILEIPMPNTRK